MWKCLIYVQKSEINEKTVAAINLQRSKIEIAAWNVPTQWKFITQKVFVNETKKIWTLCYSKYFFPLNDTSFISEMMYYENKSDTRCVFVHHFNP